MFSGAIPECIFFSVCSSFLAFPALVNEWPSFVHLSQKSRSHVRYSFLIPYYLALIAAVSCTWRVLSYSSSSSVIIAIHLEKYGCFPDCSTCLEACPLWIHLYPAARVNFHLLQLFSGKIHIPWNGSQGSRHLPTYSCILPLPMKWVASALASSNYYSFSSTLCYISTLPCHFLLPK